MIALPTPFFLHRLISLNPNNCPYSKFHKPLTSHCPPAKSSTNPTNPTSLTAPHHLSNSRAWTVTEIAEAVSGRIVKWGPPGSICTDTRTLEPNQWFLAITGENFDAHDFISPELSRKGCVGVIGNRVCKDWDRGFVEVSGNTVRSLMDMGSYVRDRFGGTVIGVTGSVGKTSTKNMIALALESLGNEVFQSYGNWNNRMGVALSLIAIPRNAGIAVLEMGMSGKGEILELAKMARPSVRVILNVGASHLGNFGSLEEVAIAKGEILVEAKAGDICILNADDPLVMSLPVPHGVEKLLFGRRMGCDIRLVLAECTNEGLGVRVVLEKNKETIEFQIPSPGLHLADNASAAAAVATLMGVSLPQVGISLSRFTPVHMRSEIEVARNGIKIVNDAYNANPISTKAAIELLKCIDCNGKRVAILGDMFELGRTEIEAHEMILSHCRDACVDLIGLAGMRFLKAAENMNLIKEKNVIHANDAENLALKIVKRLNHSDVVLVKGSRAMHMEKVVGAIKAMHITKPC